MGQNCKPYMVLWYLLSIHSSSNPNADILVTSLVLKPCAHALRQPRGSHLSWNEVLYRFARRRPQLTRGPAAWCPRRIRVWIPLLPRPLHPHTLGRISGWTPDAHSANVCFSSCGYAAKVCTGRPIEEDIHRDLPLLLEGPCGPTPSPSSVLEGSILSPVHSSS